MQKQAVSKNTSLDWMYSVELTKPHGWFAGLLNTLSGQKQNTPAAVDLPELLERGDSLFSRACDDPSNLEMDWLWLYTRVLRAEQKIYCLQQALYINPDSEFAQKALRRLKQ